MQKLLISLLVIFALTPAMIFAQDKPIEKQTVGLTFPNIGVIWHISKNIAFLPDISLSHNWSKASSFSSFSSTEDTENTGNSVSVGVGLRFYVKEWKGLRFYLTPRYGYGWGSNDNSSDTSSATSTSKNHTHSVSGSWGIQYAINSRLSLFGDIGAGYLHGSSDSSSQVVLIGGPSVSTSQASTSQTSNSVFSTGRWGLILYLK